MKKNWILTICPVCDVEYHRREGIITRCPVCHGREAMTKFIMSWGRFKVVRLAISGLAWIVEKNRERKERRKENGNK